jgi:hypothetical protein
LDDAINLATWMHLQQMSSFPDEDWLKAKLADLLANLERQKADKEAEAGANSSSRRMQIQMQCVAPPLPSLDDAINLATWMLKSQMSVDKMKLADLLAELECQKAEAEINQAKKLLIELQTSSSVDDEKVILAAQKLAKLERKKASDKELKKYPDFICECCRVECILVFLEDDITLTKCCNSLLCPECSLGQGMHYCSHRPRSQQQTIFRHMNVREYLFARMSARNGYDFPQLRRTAFQLWHIMPPSRFLGRYPLLIKPIGRLPWIISLEYKDLVFLRKFREINLMFGFLEVMHSRLFWEDSSMNWYVYQMVMRIKRNIFKFAESNIFVDMRL